MKHASSSTANGTFTGSFVAADTITGGTGADIVTGGVAADSLIGGNGGDVINGGAGADAIGGGLGDDSSIGDIGADTILGGAGDDTRVGGDGAYVFTLEANNGVDRITDFQVGVDSVSVGTLVSLAGGFDTTPISGGVSTPSQMRRFSS